MTQQDARERAWEAEDAHFADQQIPQHASRAVVKAWWWAGWDAAKREDAERIAALVAAVQRFKAANDVLTSLHEREAVDSTKTDSEWAGLVADAWFEHDRARDAMYVALRALAGSEESGQ